MTIRHPFAIWILPLLLGTTACFCSDAVQNLQKAQNWVNTDGATLQSGIQDIRTNLPPGFEQTLQAAPGAIQTLGSDPTLQASMKTGVAEIQTIQANPTLRTALANGMEQVQTLQADPTLRAALINGIGQVQDLLPTLQGLTDNAGQISDALGTVSPNSSVAWAEFPKPEGAQVQVEREQVLVFQVDRSMVDIATFYRAALANLGYTENASLALVTDQMLTMRFDHNGTNPSILIAGASLGDGKVAVTVSLP